MGLRQRLILLLKLLEQAHVLDGDDGLVREGLEQGDLTVREGARRRAGDAEAPDRDPITDQWHAKTASGPSYPSKLGGPAGQLGLSVGDHERPTKPNDFGVTSVLADRHRVEATQNSVTLGIRRRERDQMNLVADAESERAGQSTQQGVRAANGGVA